MWGDTDHRFCTYTCRELTRFPLCCHLATCYSFPAKKSVPELNDQPTYYYCLCPPGIHMKYWECSLTVSRYERHKWKCEGKVTAADEKKEFECKRKCKFQLEIVTVRFFWWYFKWPYYKINIQVRSNVQDTRTFTRNTLHNIYFSLLLHVSATLYCHLQGVTNYKNIYSICCKQSYVNGTMYILVSIYNVNILI